MNNFSVLILAAGDGTRMKSSTPKVLHRVSGEPMLGKVLKTVESLAPKSIGIVIGSGAGQVRSEIQNRSRLLWFLQKERKGSGHAVKQATTWIKRGIKSSPHIIVLCGDAPLLKAETLKALYQAHVNAGQAATVLSAKAENPFGYGRIVKDDFGRVQKIVEEKDATPTERSIREVNSGVYCFKAEDLLKALSAIGNDNAKKEYYLTDTIQILSRKGTPVGSVMMKNGMSEVLGINSRVDLAQAEVLSQKEILEHWMSEGVTILNPANTYVDALSKIGRDTVLLPGSMIMENSVIGEGCKIGPNSYIEGSKIGNRVVIRASFVYGAIIEEDSKIGPFAHIRQETVIKRGARVGNFSEIKKSVIGRDAKVSHLSYVGDAEVGEAVNIGAGVITCNYDGVHKHKTVIGKKSFVGSNVNLVAPVKVGEGSVLAAGSTITESVPPHSLALARPYQIIKKNWVKTKKRKNKI